MAKTYTFTRTHADTLYDDEERKELIRILDIATKIDAVSCPLKEKVWHIINLLTGDSTEDIEVTCGEVTSVRDLLPRDKKLRKFLQNSANKISILGKAAESFDRSKRYGTGSSFKSFLEKQGDIIILSIDDLVNILEAANKSTDATFEDIKRFIKEGIYGKLNSVSFTLSLIILNKDETPYHGNLDMLLKRVGGFDFTYNQRKLIRLIKEKTNRTQGTIRSPYRAGHPRNRRGKK